MFRNILRITATVIGFIYYFLMVLLTKKPDLNPVKAMWWNNETIKRVYTVGAKLDNRASRDKEYIQRHEALRKKIRRFLDLATIKQKLDAF